jgi:succinyl-CoA synthetase alpha subunit
MLISKEIKNIDGVVEVLVGMGTELNLELSENLGLKDDSMREISANDFFIAADVSSEEVMQVVISQVDALLSQKKTESGSDYKPVSLSGALDLIPNANLAIVSIPGQYAEAEVNKLLDADLHVMLFSDNVSVEAELSLKQKAVEKGLLMMGPDCGTAIINGIPLAFANKVKKGPIGIVGASGTGTQEVSSLIGTFGSGVSQVIGTGGRDLKSEVGGLMMIQAMQALMTDDETEVIVLISKPPAPEVAQKILEMVKDTDKPVVVDFIGGDAQMIKDAGAHSCTTLEDAALKAVALAEGKEPLESEGFTLPKDQIEKWIDDAVKILKPDQVNLRGLFTGGTLADEAMKMLGHSIGGIYSNIPLSPEYELKDLNKLEGHVCLDLGEDQFTVGRPHPMIDPSTRSDRFETDLDGSVAVCLIDVVIGYGSHEDPAGEVAKSIEDVKAKLKKEGKSIIVVASITGTEDDPQGLEASQEKLEEQGIFVLPSNAQAVRFTKEIMSRIHNS